MVLVYFDECTSQYIAEALNQLELKPKEIKVIHTLNAKGLGKRATDEQIVKIVSKNNGVLFSQDDDFKKAQVMIEAIKKYPIGLFYFKQPKSTNYWDLVRIYTKCWLNARNKILNLDIPYYFEIMSTGKIRQRTL